MAWALRGTLPGTPNIPRRVPLCHSISLSNSFKLSRRAVPRLLWPSFSPASWFSVKGGVVFGVAFSRPFPEGEAPATRAAAMGERCLYVSLKITAIKKGFKAAGASSVMQSSNYPFAQELCRWWQEHNTNPTVLVLESVWLRPGVVLNSGC